ncbi:MAG: ATP-binding protein [Gallionellaceae bacterium]|nr:ATP-binding protein [Gallionellaceae bacterium]
MRVEKRAGQALPSRAQGNRASGDAALGAVLAPLSDSGDAIRVGVLGDTGCGKTEACKKIIDGYLARSAGPVLIRDCKGRRAAYEGQEFRDVGDLAARRPSPVSRVYVLRGDLFAGIGVDPESVAEAQWRLAARNIPSLVLFDELADAADNGRWRSRPSAIDRAFGQGRAVGASVAWGTQSPQNVPRSAFEQSSYIMCFRLDGLGLNCLDDRNYLTGDGVADVIRALPGDDVPHAERGWFVLLRRGRQWDRRLYRFAL